MTGVSAAPPARAFYAVTWVTGWLIWGRKLLIEGGFWSTIGRSTWISYGQHYSDSLYENRTRTIWIISLAPSTKKKVLITDLDNTLFDWVDLWHVCFSTMLSEIVRISGISEEELKPAIRGVHQKHGTSEYSFLLEELPSLRDRFGNKDLTEVFAPAIDAYRQKRREKLRLYPVVAETLLKIKGAGAAIIGYTESMAFYSNYRVRRLGLDGVFDQIFSPADHDVPGGISDAQSHTKRFVETRY